MQTLYKLGNTNGIATSMVTLLIPGNTNLQLTVRKLNSEYGSASNIKDRANRQAIKDALKSAIFQLKLLKTLPSNGIALFSGKECYV